MSRARLPKPASGDGASPLLLKFLPLSGQAGEGESEATPRALLVAVTRDGRVSFLGAAAGDEEEEQRGEEATSVRRTPGTLFSGERRKKDGTGRVRGLRIGRLDCIVIFIVFIVRIGETLTTTLRTLTAREEEVPPSSSRPE